MAIESYATLLNRKLLIPTQKSNYIGVEMHFLVFALRPLLETIYFDEQWYLNYYPDIREAIHERKVNNGHEHYLLHGYYEHRLPYHITIDGEWYLDQYDDIKKAVMKGDFESGQTHFEAVGFREGRLPFPNFRLKTTTNLQLERMLASQDHLAGEARG
jgi:hypothetical protein